LETIVFGNFSVQDILTIAVVIISAIILIKIIKTLFKKEKNTPHLQRVRCGNCGWEGQVSRYAGRCPRCNTVLGEQKGIKK
jgi:predicted Zn-ribbon and HTH transcriptional regulator